MSPEDLVVSLQGMFGGLPPDFAEAWGTEAAEIVHGLLTTRAPDTADKRAIDEAWAGWRAFNRDAWRTPAESDAKLETLEWALKLYDAGRLTKATGLIVGAAA